MDAAAAVLPTNPVPATRLLGTCVDPRCAAVLGPACVA